MGLLEDARNIQRKDPAARSVLEVILLYPGFHILVYHRIAHWLYQHKRFFLARWVSQHGRRRTGIEIHPGAKIGRKLFIDHGMGIVFGVPGVFGLLAGGLASGFVLAVFMANSGGAWDNAKKYIEQGHVGGKGSESHKAAVIGDTVGDPFKDTSGPSLNILIKLMSMVAIVTAGVNIAVTLF